MTAIAVLTPAAAVERMRFTRSDLMQVAGVTTRQAQYWEQLGLLPHEAQDPDQHHHGCYSWSTVQLAAMVVALQERHGTRAVATLFMMAREALANESKVEGQERVEGRLSSADSQGGQSSKPVPPEVTALVGRTLAGVDRLRQDVSACIIALAEDNRRLQADVAAFKLQVKVRTNALDDLTIRYEQLVDILKETRTTTPAVAAPAPVPTPPSAPKVRTPRPPTVHAGEDNRYPPKTTSTGRKGCRVPWCPLGHAMRGYCMTHARNFQLFGDPCVHNIRCHGVKGWVRVRDLGPDADGTMRQERVGEGTADAAPVRD